MRMKLIRSGKGVAALALSLAAHVLFSFSAGAETRILCLGDSLTEGYGVEHEAAYPARLERRLKELGHSDVRVTNAGISGATSASAVSRLKWQLRERPEILILALGANDGLRGISVAEMRKNLDEAIALALDSGVRVLLAGMKLPPNYGPEYTRDFERVFTELAAERKIALIPFLLEGVAAHPELNQADGIHPTSRGYEIVTETVLDYLRPLL
jgi:acyl-CoA thioesterase-1